MAHFSSNSALIVSANDSEAAAWMASLARQALIAEAELTPKPGLVDRRGAGAHSDLSLTIMRLSARAIEPYFREMALISAGVRPTQRIREQLAAIGRNAERAMFRATGGSNAHKGAIWVLGLLISAAAMQSDEKRTASEIAATARAIASFEDRAAPRLLSHGDVVVKRYGASGARGEAVQGFPHVVDVGLPTLRRRRSRGATEHVARLEHHGPVGRHMPAVPGRNICPYYCKEKRIGGREGWRRWNASRKPALDVPRSPVTGLEGIAWRQRGSPRCNHISRCPRTKAKRGWS
jgi:hypothetical protein